MKLKGFGFCFSVFSSISCSTYIFNAILFGVLLHTAIQGLGHISALLSCIFGTQAHGDHCRMETVSFLTIKYLLLKGAPDPVAHKLLDVTDSAAPPIQNAIKSSLPCAREDRIISYDKHCATPFFSSSSCSRLYSLSRYLPSSCNIPGPQAGRWEHGGEAKTHSVSSLWKQHH